MFGPASGSLPGPGTALQLTAGDHKGRLLVPSHHSAYVHDFVSYSDDDGKTWQTITQVFPKMDEAALTQLPNGSVLLNMRHTASKTMGRAIAGRAGHERLAAMHKGRSASSTRRLWLHARMSSHLFR